MMVCFRSPVGWLENHYYEHMLITRLDPNPEFLPTSHRKKMSAEQSASPDRGSAALHPGR
jgi:hypothetical protein